MSELPVSSEKKSSSVSLSEPKDLSGRAFLQWILGALAVAALVKLTLVWAGVVPFNGDEAIVALMARHLLQGELTTFFYGQAYMGSLDAMLVAVGFKIFGEQVWVIRLVQGLLYLGTVGTTAMLGYQLSGSRRIGAIAAWLLAIPAVNVTLYTTASLGGYGEALLLGNIQLILAVWVSRRFAHPGRLFLPVFALGLVVGLGIWAFGLTLVYSLPVILYLLHQFVKQRRLVNRWMMIIVFWGVVGGLVGSAPWWLYALKHGIARLVWETRGGAIAGVEALPYWQSVGQHLFSLVVLGGTAVFGFRPPWEVRWLGLPLLPVVLFFWAAVFTHVIRRLLNWKRKPVGEEILLPLGVTITLALGFISTPFGADPSGRYFLPLAVPLSLFAAYFIERLPAKFGPLNFTPAWKAGLVALILSYHLWGNIQSALRFPPGITTQFDAVTWIDHRYMPDLIRFLRENGETRGYTNYWVAYPLAFLSQEELIFVPALPYHLDFRYTPRDNRYHPYNDLVQVAPRVAYITTNHAPLNERLRERLAASGVSWQEAQVGDYYVFYGLSQKASPNDLGLDRPGR